MDGKDKTREQLEKELADLRQQLAEFEILEAEARRTAETLQQEIIERKRTEEALRRSEQEKAVILSSMSEHVVYQDAEMNILWTNRAAAESVNLTPEQLEGRHCYEIWHRRHTPCTDCPVVKALETGRPQHDEIKSSDGRVWFVHGYPVRDETGEMQGVVEVTLDITERVRVEQALRESEQKFRSIVEQSLDGIILFDEQGTIVEWNRGQEQITGLKRSEVLGRPIWDVQFQLAVKARRTPAVYEEIRARVRDFLKTGQAPFLHRPMDQEIQRPDGQRRTIQALAFASHTDKGIASGSISRDVTELKQVESALRRRNRELELLNRASRAFGSTLDLEEVLSTIPAEVCHLLDAVGSSVWLLDQETNELICQQATGAYNEIVRGWRLAPLQGLAGWVAHNGQSLIVPDTRTDERHYKGIDQLTGLEIRSILSVPLQVQNETIGALQVVDTQAGRFDQNDLTLVESLAAVAAGAIDNARLYQDLEASREYARNIIDSSLDMIIAVDVNRTIVEFNTAAQGIFGYRPEEIVGQPDDVLYADPQQALTVYETTVEKGRCVQEVLNRRKNGQVFPSFLSASALRNVQGDLIGTMSVSRDVTEQVRTETQIQASLKEKEVLLKEIHHRVKNNLQVIYSLLNLQAGHMKDEQAVNVLHESRNRVKSMALVHEKLYRSQDLSKIDLVEYLQSLTTHLLRSYSVTARRITLKIEDAQVALGIDTAVPCGLIVNELVSNALNHAFPDDREGIIHIRLNSDENAITLIVEDNGIGFPPDLDFQNTESLGLQLVTLLVKQLNGTIELGREGGTIFRIEFTAQSSDTGDEDS